MRVGRRQALYLEGPDSYAIGAFFRLKKRFKPSAGLNHLIPSRNSEVALYSPQALAIADGSVGLVELDSHVIGNVPEEPVKDAKGAAKQDNA